MYLLVEWIKKVCDIIHHGRLQSKGKMDSSHLKQVAKIRGQCMKRNKPGTEDTCYLFSLTCESEVR